MPDYRLLVSPLADGAYFNDVEKVAREELRVVCGLEGTMDHSGPFRFVSVEASPERVPDLLRLSWVQGIFQAGDQDQAGRQLHAIDVGPELALPRPLLWGDKYAGKTNELATQMALNLALATCELPEKHRRVFDPMAGRGTTLLWAAAYGLNAIGIERDRGCVDHLHRHIKRQCKLHRISHDAHLGQVGKKNRGDVGRLGRYTFGETAIELIVGDSGEPEQLLGERKVGLIVGDAPYGIAHTASDGGRSPLDDLRRAVPRWVRALRPGGSVAILFNALQPKREEMMEIFAQQGLQPVPCELDHRMSESILRDVALFKKG